MKIKEIKSEIHDIVDKLPDSVVLDVLNYLKKITDLSYGIRIDQIPELPFKQKRDKLFDNHLIDFIFKDEESCLIFIHYTQDESIAEKILTEGFKYVNSFDKTATFVRNDQIDLTYKHYLRRPFGPVIVIICISEKIHRYYARELESRKSKDILVENILSEIPPELNEDKNLRFCLPTAFIKGYINYETGELVENKHYNPNYDSAVFKLNLEKFEKK